MAKRLAAANLRDNFRKELGYIGGAYKLTPNTPKILAESARAAAEFSKEKILDRLGVEIERAIYYFFNLKQYNTLTLRSAAFKMQQTAVTVSDITYKYQLKLAFLRRSIEQRVYFS